MQVNRVFKAKSQFPPPLGIPLIRTVRPSLDSATFAIPEKGFEELFNFEVDEAERIQKRMHFQFAVSNGPPSAIASSSQIQLVVQILHRQQDFCMPSGQLSFRQRNS